MCSTVNTTLFQPSGYTIPGIPALFLLLSGFLILTGCRNRQREYYPDGALKSEITVRHGLYDGPAVFYFEDGTRQMECTYISGKLDGPMNRYYNTGKRMESMFYRTNRPDSLFRAWDPKGNLILLCNYRDSLLDGPYTEFYPEGGIKARGQFSGGLFDGKWMYFSPEGNIAGLGEFTRGTGTQRSWYGSGSLRQVVHYRNGLKDGPEQTFDTSGILITEQVFREGNLVPVIRPQK